MAESLLALMGNNAPDDFQTPNWPIDILVHRLNLVNPKKIIWEPACGRGNIVNRINEHNIDCFGTDLKGHIDFLKDWTVGENSAIRPFDCIVTNPPFSLKAQFLKRCYDLGKPFALLMPLTALGGDKRIKMYREKGLQVLVLPKRVDFEFPDGTSKGSPWFHCAWFTHGFNLESDLIFAE